MVDRAGPNKSYQGPELISWSLNENAADDIFCCVRLAVNGLNE